MARRIETAVHHLINKERKRRGLSRVRWSGSMHKLAKEHSKKMAKKGYLFHSNLPALKGGENCWMGKGYNNKILPKVIVGSWMNSHAGHREWLLDSRVKKAGVGISFSKHGTFAAWSFSDQPVSIKPFKIKLPKLTIPLIWRQKAGGGKGVLRLPVKLFLIIISIFTIILGAHGIWVYFSRLELFFGAEANKLFLTFEVPLRLRSTIQWMTVKGVQSWIIPAAFIVLGLVLWNWQSRINAGSSIDWLKKLHLW